MRISDWSSDVCSSDLSDGADLASGGALASGTDGLAKAVNLATATGNSYAGAGNDEIYAGSGSDTLAGDALASGSGGKAEVYNTADASAGAEAGAGNDRIEDDGIEVSGDRKRVV